MSNQIVDVDVLPDHWIQKQSKSRPNQTYFFNTATGKSQWTSPAVSSGDRHRKKLTKKEPPESSNENGKGEGNCFKISNHSKQIKKRQSKTPAQDRLHNVASLHKKCTSDQQGRQRNVDTQLKNVTPAGNRLQNLATKIRNPSESMKRTASSGKIHHNQSGHNQTVTVIISPQKIETNALHSTDEIPVLFPPKTPGQDRLNRLRFSLDPDNQDKPMTNASTQHVLSVIQSEFGLSTGTSDNNNQSTPMEEDEPMDWEPCDIFEQVENTVYNELKKPYIVPDTNVFLDELSCIRDTIHSDSKKYNVLVPFVVLQELDRLKGRTGDSRISSLASGAIRFIYNELKSKTQRLQGQKATEDCTHLIDVKNADDKILNCCLQLLRESRDTILISNDINLCNKAIASGITTMTSKEYSAH